MKLKVAALTVLFSLAAQSEDVYLFKKDNIPSLVSPQSDGINISGSTEIEALGFCIDLSGNCEKSFIFNEAFLKNYARMNGYQQLPPNPQMVLPDSLILINSKFSSQNADEIELNLSYSAAGMGDLGLGIVKIEKINLSIEFEKVIESSPKRLDFSEVDSKYKQLSSKVFQIIGAPDNDGLAVSGGHGTGFLISESGYGLTNKHVLESNPNCVNKKSCSITIKVKDESIRTINVKTRVLTCSKTNDFCLFKINSDHGLSHFEIDKNHIQKSLMTLGFPYDKNGIFIVDGAKEEDTALTFSFGHPVGFLGIGINTSLFIEGGASGSPVLNESNLKVVGLISNGSNAIDSDNGMPGLFRPLYLIDKYFQITSYLDGSMQMSVENMIMQIRNSEKSDNVDSVLNEYASLKTYYGEGKLKVLSYSHHDLKTRKKLVKFLAVDRDKNW